jgi:uncharacterized protein (TIGR02453 family)
MPDAHFGPELFAFLRALKKHNDRAWFAANKERYERDVRGPALAFVRDFAAPLARISAHCVADARPVGGSLFRIQRDTRFAKDKSPYKTQVGLHFRHSRGRDAHAPGFYLHLAPGEVFAGAGVWHPDAPALARIRGALVKDPAGWKQAVGGKAFRERFRLGGEALKRPPRGFPPDHPLADDLRRKDFIAIAEFDEQAALAPDLLARFTDFCRTAAPLNRFLADALGLEF